MNIFGKNNHCSSFSMKYNLEINSNFKEIAQRPDQGKLNETNIEEAKDNDPGHTFKNYEGLCQYFISMNSRNYIVLKFMKDGHSQSVNLPSVKQFLPVSSVLD